jgi:signal peptide peptidase SppA
MTPEELRAAIAASFDSRPSLVYAPCASQIVLHQGLAVSVETDNDETPGFMRQCASAYGISDMEDKPFVYADGIALIPIYGALINRFAYCMWGYTGHQFIRNQFDAAMSDPDVQGIIFDVNSYGGSVYGNFELADYIRAGRKDKPSMAVVDSMCFSGAYSLASAADSIVASPMSDAGSIGVVMMHVDQSKMLKEWGLKVTYVYAGDHKVDGNPYEPLPDDVRNDMQASVDFAYQEFVSVVARGRGMSEKAVRETEARVFNATEAKRIGLVDAVLPPNEALAAFRNELTGSSSKEWRRTNMSKQTEAEKNAAAEQQEKDRLAAEQKAKDEKEAADKAAAEKAIADKAAADAAAASVKPTAAEAAAAERTRIMGILGCEEAKGRDALAKHFAEKTSMTVDEAKAALAVAPLVKAGAGMSPFERAMENGNPNISAGDGGGSPEAGAASKPDEVAKRIVANYRLAQGEKAH